MDRVGSFWPPARWFSSIGRRPWSLGSRCHATERFYDLAVARTRERVGSGSVTRSMLRPAVRSFGARLVAPAWGEVGGAVKHPFVPKARTRLAILRQSGICK